MKLSAEQQKQLQEHIANNWQPPAHCPVCKNNNWNLPDHVYELREFQGGGLVIGGGSGGINHLIEKSHSL